VSIIRAPRPDSGFVQIRNEVARDSRLSYKARGILVDILSRPDNWRTSADGLSDRGPDGRTAVLSGLKELREAGYLHTIRQRAEDGTFATVSLVYDVPQTLDAVQETLEPESGFPTSVSPTVIEHSSKNTHTDTPNGVSAPTEGQRINALAKRYTDLVPLSNFPAVAGVVRKAVRAGMWSEDEIAAALERLADEGRAVTTDALRYELQGFPGRQSNRERALAAGVEAVRRYAHTEAQPDPWEITA
jgi:hypothetical protein